MPFTDDDVDDDDDGTWKRVLDKSSSLGLILIDGLILDVGLVDPITCLSWTETGSRPSGRRCRCSDGTRASCASNNRHRYLGCVEKTRRTITILVERPRS